MKNSLYGFDELVQNFSAQDFILSTSILFLLIIIVGLILWRKRKI